MCIFLHLFYKNNNKSHTKVHSVTILELLVLDGVAHRNVDIQISIFSEHFKDFVHVDLKVETESSFLTFETTVDKNKFITRSISTCHMIFLSSWQRNVNV